MFQPDEPGIKLLPDALLSNYKEFQDMWEEDELIRSLEARPPSPCNVTFINDNILIDGKSSFIQRSTKRVKVSHIFYVGLACYRRVRLSGMRFVKQTLLMKHLLSAYQSLQHLLNRTYKACRKCFRMLQKVTSLSQPDYR